MHLSLFFHLFLFWLIRSAECFNFDHFLFVFSFTLNRLLEFNQFLLIVPLDFRWPIGADRSCWRSNTIFDPITLIAKTNFRCNSTPSICEREIIAIEPLQFVKHKNFPIFKCYLMRINANENVIIHVFLSPFIDNWNSHKSETLYSRRTVCGIARENNCEANQSMIISIFHFVAYIPANKYI